MNHLGVKLDAKDTPLLVFHDGQSTVRGRHPLEAGRHRLDPVAVAHPDLHRPGESIQQRRGTGPFQSGLSVFPAGGVNLAAEPVGQELHPIADSKQRDMAGVNSRIGIRSTLLEHGPGPSGQDDSAGPATLDLLKRRVVGKHLREDACLTNPAGNQLRILGPEVENDDDFSPAHRNLFARSGIRPSRVRDRSFAQ